MTSLRKIDRDLNPAPIVDSNFFPVLSKQEFTDMVDDWNVCASEYAVYPFFRTYDDTEYVDVYFWNKAISDTEPARRFVIVDKTRLSLEDESIFLLYTRAKGIHTDDSRFYSFGIKVIRHFPQWHFKYYPAYSIGQALEHMYFASHPGVLEKLYKADLVNIAYNYENIINICITGKSPSAILGGLPIKLLRILDSKPEMLYHQESFDACKGSYKKYCGVIGGDDIPSFEQFCYVMQLYNNNGIFGGYPFKRIIYENAERFMSGARGIDVYSEFLTVLSELGIPAKSIVFPKSNADMIAEVNKIKYYKKAESLANLLFKKRIESDGNKYEYQNSKYNIRMVSSSFEMYGLSKQFRNCLEDYIPTHASGLTTVLYISRNGSDRPLYAVEISPGGMIEQVYGKGNSLASIEVYEFIGEYIKVKDFSADLEVLILDNIKRNNLNMSSANVSALIKYANENCMRFINVDDGRYKRLSELIHNDFNLGADEVEF